MWQNFPNQLFYSQKVYMYIFLRQQKYKAAQSLGIRFDKHAKSFSEKLGF